MMEPTKKILSRLGGWSSLIAAGLLAAQTGLAAGPDNNFPRLPDVLVVEQESPSGTIVRFSYSAVDNCDPNPVVTANPDSGSMFPPGSTEVLITASDSSGNSSFKTRIVQVVDTTAPVITLNGPEAVTLEAMLDPYLEEGAIAVDVGDMNVAVVIGGDEVDTTTPGTYEVTYDATDASGNSAVTKTRTVTVISQQELKLQALAELLGMGEPLDKSDAVKIRHAIKKVTESLDGRLWATKSTLTKLGGHVFDREGDAVWYLEGVPGAEGVIEMLVHVDESLALVAIGEAVSSLHETDNAWLRQHAGRKIAEAQEQMQLAAEELENYEKYANLTGRWVEHYRRWWHKLAIEHYKHAWRRAMEALRMLEDTGHPRGGPG